MCVWSILQPKMRISLYGTQLQFQILVFIYFYVFFICTMLEKRQWLRLRRIEENITQWSEKNESLCEFHKMFLHVSYTCLLLRFRTLRNTVGTEPKTSWRERKWNGKNEKSKENVTIISCKEKTKAIAGTGHRGRFQRESRARCEHKMRTREARQSWTRLRFPRNPLYFGHEPWMCHLSTMNESTTTQVARCQWAAVGVPHGNAACPSRGTVLTWP